MESEIGNPLVTWQGEPRVREVSKLATRAADAISDKEGIKAGVRTGDESGWQEKQEWGRQGSCEKYTHTGRETQATMLKAGKNQFAFQGLQPLASWPLPARPSAPN